MPVTGVGGAAEASTRLVGSVSEEDEPVASAAFRFLVMGGMVPLGRETLENARRWASRR
jgi:hypothetical protein